MILMEAATTDNSLSLFELKVPNKTQTLGPSYIQLLASRMKRSEGGSMASCIPLYVPLNSNFTGAFTPSVALSLSIPCLEQLNFQHVPESL